MTTPTSWNPSGQYQYFPLTGDLVAAAFARIQIRRAEILQEHLENARNEINLLQISWSNLGPTLFTVELQTVALTGAAQTFPVDPSVVMILDAYVSTANGDGTYSDRIIMPLSRTEWASTPNKLGVGSPTSFWFDRLYPLPTITLWPFPNGTSDASFSYYAFQQIQDANLSAQQTAQIPYLWLDAYVAGLAKRLSIIYPPPARPVPVDYEAEALKAYNSASMQGSENVPLYIAPATAPYYR